MKRSRAEHQQALAQFLAHKPCAAPSLHAIGLCGCSARVDPQQALERGALLGGAVAGAIDTHTREHAPGAGAPRPRDEHRTGAFVGDAAGGERSVGVSGEIGHGLAPLLGSLLGEREAVRNAPLEEPAPAAEPERAHDQARRVDPVRDLAQLALGVAGHVAPEPRGIDDHARVGILGPPRTPVDCDVDEPGGIGGEVHGVPGVARHPATAQGVDRVADLSAHPPDGDRGAAHGGVVDGGHGGGSLLGLLLGDRVDPDRAVERAGDARGGPAFAGEGSFGRGAVALRERKLCPGGEDVARVAPELGEGGHGSAPRHRAAERRPGGRAGVAAAEPREGVRGVDLAAAQDGAPRFTADADVDDVHRLGVVLGVEGDDGTARARTLDGNAGADRDLAVVGGAGGDIFEHADLRHGSAPHAGDVRGDAPQVGSEAPRPRGGDDPALELGDAGGGVVDHENTLATTAASVNRYSAPPTHDPVTSQSESCIPPSNAGAPAPAKRKPGRPKGSKSKSTLEREARERAEAEARYEKLRHNPQHSDKLAGILAKWLPDTPPAREPDPAIPRIAPLEKPTAKDRADARLAAAFGLAPEHARRLSDQHRKVVANAARIERARRSLRMFVRLAFAEVIKPGVALVWGWYLDAICDHLQAQFEDWLIANGHEPASLPGLRERVDARWRAHGLEREARRLLVQNMAYNVAPGTLKSVIAMVAFPAWVWIHYPPFQWAMSSGAPGNVTRDSNMHKEIVRSKWYRESFGIKWEIRSDVDSKELWQTTAGGSRLSRGMNAQWTGVHADAIGLDDPDGAFTVFSEAARRETQGQWTNAMENRVNDPDLSFRFIVQQHVHSDDLTSSLLNLGVWSPESYATRARWGKLEIGMEFKPERRHTTPYGWTDPRDDAGAIMHAERFSPEFLASKREKLGTYGYEAQYNQAPEVADGGMVQRIWFRFFKLGDDLLDAAGGLILPAISDPRPRPSQCRPRDPQAEGFDPPFVLTLTKAGRLDLDWLVLSVDASFGSLKASASNVALEVWGGKGNRRFLLEDSTKKRTYPETERDVIAMIAKWCPDRALIENKANGPAVIQQLEKAIADAQIVDAAGKPVVCVLEVIEPKEDGGSKEARLAACSASIEAGLVYLFEGAPWLDDYVSELCGFPNGKRDDRVDATTQVLNRYRDVISVIDRWRALAG